MKEFKVYDICGHDCIVCYGMDGEVLEAYIEDAGVDLSELHWDEEDIDKCGIFIELDQEANRDLIDWLEKTNKNELTLTDFGGETKFGSLVKYEGEWLTFQPYSRYLEINREMIEKEIAAKKLYWLWSTEW